MKEIEEFILESYGNTVWYSMFNFSVMVSLSTFITAIIFGIYYLVGKDKETSFSSEIIRESYTRDRKKEDFDLFVLVSCFFLLSISTLGISYVGTVVEDKENKNNMDSFVESFETDKGVVIDYHGVVKESEVEDIEESIDGETYGCTENIVIRLSDGKEFLCKKNSNLFN